jgi:ABC-type sugar transport system ATPase subunit
MIGVVGQEPMLSIRQLHKNFSGTAVLQGIDLTVRKGEITFVTARAAAASRLCCAV